MKKKLIGGIAILTVVLSFAFVVNMNAQYTPQEMDNGSALGLSESDCKTYCVYSPDYACKLTQGSNSYTCMYRRKK